MGIRSDLQTELKNLLASDIIKGKVSVQRAYADWRRYPQYIVPLAESSIDMIMAPAYGSAKKNATDIRLAIDALELVFVRPEIGTFILLSGDSDFSSLVIKLKEYGKYVIGVGIRESSSDLLVMNCDEYYSYNSLAGLVKSGEEELVKHDPWELVSEAVQRMKRNGDVMRADRLKQVMQQMDSSFDEKNVGKSKFSLFVAEAAKKGLLSLTKLENGQYEVDLPRAGVIGLPAGQSAPAAEPSENGEARRPRRESRGRGRERSRVDRIPRGADDKSGVSDATSAAPGAAAVTPQAPESVIADHIPSIPAAAPPPIAGPAASSGSAKGGQSTSRAPAAATTPSRRSSGDEIGATGLRLTREEAFDLVRRAVASLVSGDAAAPASAVRARARALLGRDSESLSERNFTRILQDAHDGDAIDLRRRGNDYEVAVAAGAAPVSAQLAAAETANTPAVAAPIAAPRGMSARGGRGPMGRPGIPPAHILNIGVVGTRASSASAPPAAATAAVTPSSTSAEIPASSKAEKAPAVERAPRARKRAAAKKPATKKRAAAADSEADAAVDTSAEATKPAAAARKRGARGGRTKAKASASAAPRSDTEAE
jgi:uncharacterized LabA/DUF88 family protein